MPALLNHAAKNQGHVIEREYYSKPQQVTCARGYNSFKWEVM